MWQLWQDETPHTTKQWSRMWLITYWNKQRALKDNNLSRHNTSNIKKDVCNDAERKLKRKIVSFWKNSHCKNTMWDKYSVEHTRLTDWSTYTKQCMCSENTSRSFIGWQEQYIQSNNHTNNHYTLPLT
jgi:hypothetical protein